MHCAICGIFIEPWEEPIFWRSLTDNDEHGPDFASVAHPDCYEVLANGDQVVYEVIRESARQEPGR
jgi:hypothetical protein